MCKVTKTQVNGQTLVPGKAYNLYVKSTLSDKTALFQRQTFKGIDCLGDFGALMFSGGTVHRHQIIEAVKL